MNAQNEDSDLLSVSSSEIQETAIEDATEAFLSAATEGNVELLTRLYESETKVPKECHKNRSNYLLFHITGGHQKWLRALD